MSEAHISNTENSDVVKVPPTSSSSRLDARLHAVLQAPEVDLASVAILCRQGVSSKARPVVWKILMGFYPLQPCRWAEVEALATQQYVDMYQAVCDLDSAGNPLPSDAVGRSIDVDVPRTMPSLHFFLDGTAEGKDDGFSTGQNYLRRIMYTLAKVNRGFGYVQGMNELVGHIVYAFSEGNNQHLTRSIEADSFFCFQTLFSYLGDSFCRTLDDDTESGVISAIRHFDKALYFFDADVLAHLQAHGVCAEHYALRWLMLLFTQEFNVADTLRIWDFLLSFGDQIRTVSVFVAVAMCHHQADLLLSMNSLSDIVPVLLNYPSGDINDFLRIAMRWIAKYDLSFMELLRTSTLDEIAALRKQYDVRARSNAGSISHAVQHFMQSLLGE